MARLLNEPRRSVDASLDNAGESFWVCEASTTSSGLPTLRARPFGWLPVSIRLISPDHPRSLAYSRHDDAAHEVCYPNWLAWVLKSRFFEKSESSGLVPIYEDIGSVN